MRSALVVALVVALALVPARAAEEEVVEARWRYRVSIPDLGSGNVRVDLAISGVEGHITRFTFLTNAHREPVTNVTGGPHTLLEEVLGGIAFDVDGEESFSYDVRVERDAYRTGEKLGHSGHDFALFKMETATLEYRFTFYEGRTFRNQTSVELVPPAGWQARGPWNETAPLLYEMPRGVVLPRGYVVFGKFLAEEHQVAGDKVVHYVRLGKVGSYEEDRALYSFIERSTPYYTAVYGGGVERDILVVNAPDPMFHGGLGGQNSFFVHESADLRTVAHEYAHVFQLFGTDEEPGHASIWLNEGDADLHSALALLAADVWSPTRVNDFFREAEAHAHDPAVRDGILTDAAYGTKLEDLAYRKGLVVLRALDRELYERTQGERGIADLLRALNAVHGDPSRPEASQPVTNEEVQAVAERLAGSDLSGFFDAYVHGPAWPLPLPPFLPEGQLVVDQLTVTPPRAAPGEGLLVRATLANRGTSEVRRPVELLLDGAVVARADVALGVGATTRLEFPLVAPAPGEHEARLLYETTTFRSLTRPNVVVGHTTLVPAALVAGEPGQLLVFLENTGEQQGTARVELVAADGEVLAASTETVVDGGGAATVPLALLFRAPGVVDATLHVETPEADVTVPIAIEVRAPTPVEDGFGSLVQGGKEVPAPGLFALLLAALGALARRRRRVG